MLYDRKANHYHVTPSTHVESILKYGLIPQVGKRSVQLNEEPSIFLFKTELDMEDAMMNWLGDEFDEDEDLIVLSITLPIDRILKSEAGYEVQVMTVISPLCIEIFSQL